MERVIQYIVAVALAAGLVGSASATPMTLAELSSKYTDVYEAANIDFSDGCVYFSCAGNLLVNGYVQEQQSSSSDDSFSSGLTAISGTTRRETRQTPHQDTTETPANHDNPEIVTVTEPGTLALLALSIIGLVMARKNKKVH